jgi:hypothetical protein
MSVEPSRVIGDDMQVSRRVATRGASALLRTASLLLEPSWTESLRSELRGVDCRQGASGKRNARAKLPKACRERMKAGKKAWT